MKETIPVFIPDNDGEGDWREMNAEHLDLSAHDARVIAEYESSRKSHSCNHDCDALYQSYEKGRADAIDERANLLAFICKKYNIPLLDMNCTVDEWERLKEQKE